MGSFLAMVRTRICRILGLAGLACAQPGGLVARKFQETKDHLQDFIEKIKARYKHLL